MDGAHGHLWTWYPSYEINWQESDHLQNHHWKIFLFGITSGCSCWNQIKGGRRHWNGITKKWGGEKMPNDFIWGAPQELLFRQSWRQSYLCEVRVATIYIAQPLTKWAIKIKYLWVWFWGQPSHQGKAQTVLSTLEITQRFSSQGMAMSHLSVPGPQPLPFS